ncbi:methyl-accepting chemotaxis protein [Pseudothermotoga sp.]|nr:methyl-accepting chemotaxis protein [Pseudothermotoga sp.]MDW8140535.1 methyl-accepting chemotaxis protein [Pseudothermotoga sp.]
MSSVNHAEIRKFERSVLKSLLFVLFVVDPLALLFSYYVFAGLGKYPVWIILLGYAIMLAALAPITIYVAILLARKAFGEVKYNLPTVLALLIFSLNFSSATFIGFIARLIRPLPTETLILRLAGALAINVNIIAVLVLIYSQSKFLREYEGPSYSNIMVPMSLKLTLTVLSISMWIAPILLKYMLSKVVLSEEIQRNFVIMSVILNVILAVLVILLSKRILSGLPGIVNLLNEMSSGNLVNHVTVGSVDEFRYICGKLNDASRGISEILRETLQISSSSLRTLKDLMSSFNVFENIARSTIESVQSQQRGVERITSSTEQIATNIQQLASQAQSLADLAIKVQRLSEALDERSKSSASELARAKSVTSSFVEEYETLEREIHKLMSATKNIEGIVESVRSIAEQTNLLALNAAIEAARAGEAGRGFAVVAEEIRKLSEETRRSTDTVISTIQSVEESSKSLNRQIEKLRQDIESTEKSYENLFETFDYLNKAIAELRATIDTLASSSEEQSAAVEEMNSGVNEIASNISKISAQGGEVSVNMQKLSEHISELVTKLKDVAISFETLMGSLRRFKLERST